MTRRELNTAIWGQQIKFKEDVPDSMCGHKQQRNGEEKIYLKKKGRKKIIVRESNT